MRWPRRRGCRGRCVACGGSAGRRRGRPTGGLGNVSGDRRSGRGRRHGRAGLGRVHRGQHHRRGLYAAALARELADECGGLCTPVLRTPAGLKLSRRQRDVIEVVAGLSNRQIAETLVMSVRTVEGHVYRA
ncbi:LuxR C-terminal-related transcriptional regulator [Mycobacterium kansasii]